MRYGQLFNVTYPRKKPHCANGEHHLDWDSNLRVLEHLPVQRKNRQLGKPDANRVWYVTSPEIAHHTHCDDLWGTVVNILNVAPKTVVQS